MYAGRVEKSRIEWDLIRIVFFRKSWRSNDRQLCLSTSISRLFYLFFPCFRQINSVFWTLLVGLFPFQPFLQLHHHKYDHARTCRNRQVTSAEGNDFKEISQCFDVNDHHLQYNNQ